MSLDKADTDLLRSENAKLREALEATGCPRPCNGRPDDLTAGECIASGECGCSVGSVLSELASTASPLGKGSELTDQGSELRSEPLMLASTASPLGKEQSADHASRYVVPPDCFWLELREPRRVPQRKGPFPLPSLAKTLREFMVARPEAYITVVTVGAHGPDFQDGPEALQVADGRSMTTARKHIQSSHAAHSEATPSVVPPGYVLVPREPTDKMTFVGQSMRYDMANSIGAIYRAMIAAAPAPGIEPPSGDKGGE